MIGNLSFEEHDRYFTKMYNHLKRINQNLDITTIINIIKYKVILEQEQENIMHNLNIKNIYDTPMVKDFEIWFAKYNWDENEEDDELHPQDESSENDDEEVEIDSEDDEYSDIEYRHNEIPEGF